MTDELKRQYTLRITQANRSELTVVVFDMALSYLEDVKAAETAQDRMAFREAIRHANGCINELLSSLDYQQTISVGLGALYTYMIRELALIDMRNRTEGLDEIAGMLHKLRDSFEIASRDDTGAPLMQNAQTVYAGLTYGRDALNESLQTQSRSRGICV